MISPLSEESLRDPHVGFTDAVDGLHAVLIHLEQFHAACNNKNVLDRYALGRLVGRLVNVSGRYGRRNVRQAANRLGVSPDYLYDSAKVADAWDEHELRDLLDEIEEEDSRPLSWSHLVELSEHPIAEDRPRLAMEACREQLTVVELRERLLDELDSA